MGANKKTDHSEKNMADIQYILYALPLDTPSLKALRLAATTGVDIKVCNVKLLQTVPDYLTGVPTLLDRRKNTIFMGTKCLRALSHMRTIARASPPVVPISRTPSSAAPWAPFTHPQPGNDCIIDVWSEEPESIPSSVMPALSVFPTLLKSGRMMIFKMATLTKISEEPEDDEPPQSAGIHIEEIV